MALRIRASYVRGVEHHLRPDTTHGRWLAEDPFSLVRRHLPIAGCGWSVGTWGAIGEFCFVDGEQDVSIDAAALQVTSRRGALRVRRHPAARACAVTADEDGAISEIAICLPAEVAGRAARATLTEIGPDHAAVDARWRDGLLFDLGIAADHIDMLVRVDPAAVPLLRALRMAQGNAFLSAPSATSAVAAGSPPRIFESALARLEVHVPIPPPGGRSPEGPHSHLLPDLLAQKRTRGPRSPLPDGWLCGLSLYPRLA